VDACFSRALEENASDVNHVSLPWILMGFPCHELSARLVFVAKHNYRGFRPGENNGVLFIASVGFDAGRCRRHGFFVLFVFRVRNRNLESFLSEL